MSPRFDKYDPRNTVKLVLTDQAVYLARTVQVRAYDAKDGRLLWEGKTQNAFFTSPDLFVTGGAAKAILPGFASSSASVTCIRFRSTTVPKDGLGKDNGRLASPRGSWHSTVGAVFAHRIVSNARQIRRVLGYVCRAR